MLFFASSFGHMPPITRSGCPITKSANGCDRNQQKKAAGARPAACPFQRREERRLAEGRLHATRRGATQVVIEGSGGGASFRRQRDIALLQRLLGLQVSIALLVHAGLRGLREGR